MLDTAFAFGADAVYAGQPRYSLRVRNNDFGDLPVLAEGITRIPQMCSLDFDLRSLGPDLRLLARFA